MSGLLAADALLFGTTDPNSTVSFMLIVGFIMMSVTVYYLLKGLLSLGRLYGLRVKKEIKLLRTMTALISGLLALQSIGQLSSRDILVLMPLTLLMYLYVAYTKSSRPATAGTGPLSAPR